MLDSIIGRGSKGHGSFRRLPWRKHLLYCVATVTYTGRTWFILWLSPCRITGCFRWLQVHLWEVTSAFSLDLNLGISQRLQLVHVLTKRERNLFIKTCAESRKQFLHAFTQHNLKVERNCQAADPRDKVYSVLGLTRSFDTSARVDLPLPGYEIPIS